jgi:hypothetical protein
VHRAEGGGGEGDEGPRLGSDGLGDAFVAAGESGADEVEGVGGVAVGLEPLMPQGDGLDLDGSTRYSSRIHKD